VTWRGLMAVLLGVLVVGVIAEGIPIPVATGVSVDSSVGGNIRVPIFPHNTGDFIVKTFAGASNFRSAKRFIQQYRDELTLQINFSMFNNATFVGIALRRLPTGAYAPLYYFGYCNEDLEIGALQREFYLEADRFNDIPPKVVGALSNEPPRNWNYIGAIRSMRTSLNIRTLKKDTVTVYNEIGVDFWATSGASGQYVYYVYLTHEAKVPKEEAFPGDFKVAAKELNERITVLDTQHTFIGLGNFKPEGSGSSSNSVITWGINVGVDTAGRPLPSAQAGFSESYTKGVTFKWYTDDIDPNSEIQFEFYDLKKRVWLGSSPVWGQIFISHPVVLVHVEPGTPFHEGNIRIRAKATFFYEDSARVCRLRYGGCVLLHEEKSVNAPPVEFTAEMYPWFITRK